MKLKYYLRGLGVGILVTASLIISAGQKESLTDQQIKERAKALGMQESGVLASLVEENSSYPEESSSKEQVPSEAMTSSSQESTKSNGEESSEAKSSSAATMPSENESVQSVAASKDKEPSKSETEPKKEPSSSEALSTEKPSKEEVKNTEIQSRIIEIVINSGDGSETVSQKMEQAGLVSSAKEYNEFLCQNGYDRKLAAGSHNIPFDATYSEMAEILCKRR